MHIHSPGYYRWSLKIHDEVRDRNKVRKEIPSKIFKLYKNLKNLDL